jgi:hypothetical protein
MESLVISWLEDKLHCSTDTRPVQAIRTQVTHHQSSTEADFAEQLATCLNMGHK